ncbi:MAG TPA: riboflavin synthase [Polyangiaceae bacterium]|jgi:riboflavin synthase|nr:riboflavin synthase [Polyangiaceae bacterium]
MFTGLVELKGTLARRARRGPGFRLAVEAATGLLTLGESISVSGACLTVVNSDGRSFEADVSLETAAKTTLGALTLGSSVNLERALKVGDRLGGHLVSGHVDAVAELRRVVAAGDAKRLAISYPRELARFIAAKGSVALDGVSLTVNEIVADVFEVMVIPHTLAVTTLGELKAGALLNLEVDTLARYAVRFLDVSASESSRGDDQVGIKSALRRAGFDPDPNSGNS